MKKPKDIDEKDLARFIGVGIFMLVLGLAGGGMIWILIHSFTSLSYFNCLALYYAAQVTINMAAITQKYSEGVKELYDRLR